MSKAFVRWSYWKEGLCKTLQVSRFLLKLNRRRLFFDWKNPINKNMSQQHFSFNSSAGTVNNVNYFNSNITPEQQTSDTITVNKIKTRCWWDFSLRHYICWQKIKSMNLYWHSHVMKGKKEEDKHRWKAYKQDWRIEILLTNFLYEGLV